MIKIVTHNDLDGSGCILVARHFFGKDRLDITHTDHNSLKEVVKEVLERADEYEYIFFTDICPEEECVIKLSKFENVCILDHHKSSEELAHKYDIVILDMEQCGTKLFYNYLLQKFGEDKRNNKLEEFIELVDYYDRWVEDDPQKKERGNDLNMLFQFYGTNYFENNRGFDIGQDVSEKEQFILKVLKHKEEIYVKQQLKKIEPLKIGKHLFALCFLNTSWTIVANAINRIGVYDGVIIPQPTSNGVSIYSHKIDISKIAKSVGGGGHPRASGFPMDFKNKIKEMIKEKLG